MNELVRSGGVRLGMPFGSVVLWLAVCAILVVVVLGWREHLGIADARRRWLLHGLRLLSGVGALSFLLQPEWIRERVQQMEGRLAVLVDASRSMSVRDAQGTRAQRAAELALRYYDEASDKPALFAFGDEVMPLATAALRDASLVPRDDTRIAAALRALVAQDENLGAVLVISDGADRGGALDSSALGKLGVRVHTVAIGEASQPTDTAIEALHADPVAFLRQSAQVQVKVRGARAQKEPLPVTLRRNGEVVHESNAVLDDEGRATVTLPFVPTRMGRAVYTVSVPVAQDDSVPENNERAFLVRVTRERLRVLLVCGHPSWDARFLRAFLKNNPAIDLITFFILRTGNDNSMAPPEELSLIPFPTEELFEEHIESFDLVLFQDFDFGPYQMARYLPRIREYVLAGGSFAMLGGDRSFGAGGYQGTPIADVLPVELLAGERALDAREFQPAVVPEATHHPIVELLPRPLDNAAAWQALAPLPGTNVIAGVRQDAQALLVHPVLTGRDGQPMPVLAVDSIGQGRSLAFTSDASYRFGISTAGRTGDASAYDHFWDRALRWLARDPLLDPAQLTTDRERYGPQAEVRVSVWLRDARYRPLSPGRYRLTLQDAQGATLRELAIETDAEGKGTAVLQAPSALGGFTLGVHAEDKPEPLAQESLVIEAGGEELADPRARPEQLRAIAKATGGEFFADAAGAPPLAGLPKTRTRVLGTSVVAPFRSPWFFVLLVACWGAEWFLRRRLGLR